MRNVEAKTLGERCLEVQGALVRVEEAATPEAGAQAAQAFLNRYGKEFPRGSEVSE